MVTSRPRAWSWRRWARILRSRSALRACQPGPRSGNLAAGSDSRCQMMTRMDLATAHWALMPPMRLDRRRNRSPRKVLGAGGAEGGLGAVALEVGVAVSLARLAGAGAGLAGDGGQPGPGGQVGGGREPGHVQAGLGDDRAGQVGADAGDLREPLRGGQGGGVRAAGRRAGRSRRRWCPRRRGSRPGRPRSRPRSRRPTGPAGRCGPGGRGSAWGGGRRACMPSRACAMAARPPLTLPCGQGGQGLRVALAAGDGLQDGAGRLGPGQRVHRRTTA